MEHGQREDIWGKEAQNCGVSCVGDWENKSIIDRNRSQEGESVL